MISGHRANVREPDLPGAPLFQDGRTCDEPPGDVHDAVVVARETRIPVGSQLMSVDAFGRSHDPSGAGILAPHGEFALVRGMVPSATGSEPRKPHQ